MERKQQVEAVMLLLLASGIEATSSHHYDFSTIVIERGRVGIAFLSKEVLSIIMQCPNFEGIRAGFQSGTFTLTFK